MSRSGKVYVQHVFAGIIRESEDGIEFFYELINDSYLPEDMKAGMNTLIGKRMLILR